MRTHQLRPALLLGAVVSAAAEFAVAVRSHSAPTLQRALQPLSDHRPVRLRFRLGFRVLSAGKGAAKHRCDGRAPLRSERREGEARHCPFAASRRNTPAALIPATSSPGPRTGRARRCPHLRRDWARPCPHLHRDWRFKAAKTAHLARPRAPAREGPALRWLSQPHRDSRREGGGGIRLQGHSRYTKRLSEWYTLRIYTRAGFEAQT